jgi:hypothetical protein
MELYAGLTQRVYLDIYEEGELRNPDDLPQVSVYDGETDVLLTTGFAQKEIDDEGHYGFTIVDNYIQTDKLIKVVWSYVIDLNAMQTVNYYEIVTPYVSLSEIYSRLGLGREEGDSNYTPFKEIAESEKFARFLIENYTGVRFGKYSKSITAYGQDSDVLFLGERIISFSQLKENGKLVIDITSNLNSFNFPIEITETHHSLRIVAPGYDIEEGHKKDIVYPLRGSFYNGYRYDVVGVFGYKSVPSKVQAAAIMLMKDYFGKDNIWRARYVNSVSFGDTDMEFSKLAFRGTGNFYADKILDEYKSTNMAVI